MTMTPLQYQFYAEHIKLDEQEQAERNRDYIEYLARFWNNEAVEKIQRARRDKKELSEDEFTKGLETLFGRPLQGPVNNRPEDILENLGPSNFRPDDIRVIKKSPKDLKKG